VTRALAAGSRILPRPCARVPRGKRGVTEDGISFVFRERINSNSSLVHRVFSTVNIAACARYARNSRTRGQRSARHTRMVGRGSANARVCRAQVPVRGAAVMPRVVQAADVWPMARRVFPGVLAQLLRAERACECARETRVTHTAANVGSRSDQRSDTRGCCRTRGGFRAHAALLMLRRCRSFLGLRPVVCAAFVPTVNRGKRATVGRATAACESRRPRQRRDKRDSWPRSEPTREPTFGQLLTVETRTLLLIGSRMVHQPSVGHS